MCALATKKNISLLEKLKKIGQHWKLTSIERQLAKEQDSPKQKEVFNGLGFTKAEDSVLTGLSTKAASKVKSFLASWLVWPHARPGCSMCACANERLRDGIIRVYMHVPSMHYAVFYIHFS